LFNVKSYLTTVNKKGNRSSLFLFEFVLDKIDKVVSNTNLLKVKTFVLMHTMEDV